MGKIAIIGLGMIGGSMGLAIKRAEPEQTEVIGYDRDPEVAMRAQRFGAVQSTAPTAVEAVRTATMVIVATPIAGVRRIFEEIGPHLQTSAVVTDTASTKTEVMRWAKELLPPKVHFVGCHPMAGKEQSGPQAAEETLFDGRPYCLVPSLDASPGAVNEVMKLVEYIGAKPFFLDAEEHDAYAAAISHIPLVASLALFTLARGSTAWPELASMSGPAFKDLTRLASGRPEMAHDIFLTNRANVVHWLERYIGELRKLADLIEEDDSELLFRVLAETQIERDEFLENPPKRDEPGEKVEMPSQMSSFVDMMAGSLWQQRAREISQTIEERTKAREREERLRRRD
jgi:prephenate dehydrogenase